MRVIIYTGKGGVGKTSVAAATAVKLAEQGFRTLILSTDAANSLSDAFQVALGSEPVRISERLWGGGGRQSPGNRKALGRCLELAVRIDELGQTG